MSTPTRLSLVECPRRWDPQQGPSNQDIPRLRHPGRTSTDWPAYEAEQAFDANVFQTLLVGGLGATKRTPTDGEDMLILIFGAIRLAGFGEGVDPKSFQLLLPGEALYGGWELTWQALQTGKICPTITASLERLLVPSSEAGQNDADDSSSGNEALRRFWSGPWGSWWTNDYYVARYRTSVLATSLVSQGTGLEKFTLEEQTSLRLLIEGVATMQPLVEAAFSR